GRDDRRDAGRARAEARPRGRRGGHRGRAGRGTPAGEGLRHRAGLPDCEADVGRRLHGLVLAAHDGLMARPHRIVYPGAWYHVSSRGGGKTPVFADGDGGRQFLATLAEVSIAMGVEVHAYCLLVDGYHLLLRTPRANLPSMMRQLNGQYAHWCRRDPRRVGRVFDRRYHSVLLDPDEWPLRLSRYIHLQPQAHGLVSDPLLYRWSSLRAYGGRGPRPPWLETDALTRLVGGPEPYLAYVGYGIDAETRAF